MPRSPEVPDVLRGRVFRGSAVVRRGLLTPDQLRSSAWRRIRRDVYADARLAVDHGLAVAGCALIMPPGASIAGRSAAWLYGVRQTPPDAPVDVLLPGGSSWSPPGVSPHIQDVPAEDLASYGRRLMTIATRACVDIARWYDAVLAVPIIDEMLARRLVAQPDLAGQLHRAAGQRLAQARQTLALCDGRAESPPESVLRVRLILAGLPAPVPQHEIWRSNQFVARVDLGWPERQVAVEYDGAYHGAPGQLGRDRRRLNALIAAGWTVIHVTAADMLDLTPVIRQLSSLLRKSA